MQFEGTSRIASLFLDLFGYSIVDIKNGGLVMSISTVVNEYAKGYSPYMRGLVNHLPMGQLALYFLTNDLEKVKNYSKYYEERSDIDPIKHVGVLIKSIDDCLGQRDLYEPLLDYLNQMVDEDNVGEYISYVLNTYPLGMSSGLFHTLIRLAYAVEGYEEDKGLLMEIKRALSYYVTGCRESKMFTRPIEPEKIVSEMKMLRESHELDSIVSSQPSTGKKMKALYNSQRYVNDFGFIINAYEDDKINALLDLIVPAYINSKGEGNILILHCITGLHALIVLKDYFNDFDQALDIMTTCIITHLMTLDNLTLESIEDKDIDVFDNLIAKGVESKDVHTIKLTYTTNEIYRKYNRNDLKIAADKRIKHT